MTVDKTNNIRGVNINMARMNVTCTMDNYTRLGWIDTTFYVSALPWRAPSVPPPQ